MNGDGDRILMNIENVTIRALEINMSVYVAVDNLT